jgi:hypothetical protein
VNSEIESLRPALSVILDDGDFIINSTGPVGKLMAQAILPACAAARKVTIITDGSMQVMKRNGNGANSAQENLAAPAPSRRSVVSTQAVTGESLISDTQDQFAADLAAGITGVIATGEVPSPTPGPSDPVVIPAKRRRPQIFQDAAAPPAPELAEAEMERLLAEAAQADQDAAKAAEDQRFQRQQAVQAQVDPVEAEATAKPAPRKREPRQLATSGRPCGRCGGGGQVVGDAGFQGACPVCHGEGQVKTWDRALKVR